MEITVKNGTAVRPDHEAQFMSDFLNGKHPELDELFSGLFVEVAELTEDDTQSTAPQLEPAEPNLIFSWFVLLIFVGFISAVLLGCNYYYGHDPSTKQTV